MKSLNRGLPKGSAWQLINEDVHNTRQVFRRFFRTSAVDFPRRFGACFWAAAQMYCVNRDVPVPVLGLRPRTYCVNRDVPVPVFGRAAPDA